MGSNQEKDIRILSSEILGKLIMLFPSKLPLVKGWLMDKNSTLLLKKSLLLAIKHFISLINDSSSIFINIHQENEKIIGHQKEGTISRQKSISPNDLAVFFQPIKDEDL